MRRTPSHLLLVLILSCVSTLTFSQGARVRQETELVPEANHDQDEALRREQWFRHGRTFPGESTAALRLRAHRQRLQLRAIRIEEAKQAGQAGKQNTPLTTVWTPLGPAPLNSDATNGFQDYGWVSGRATAVAVDPTDSTGNTVYAGGAYGGLWKSVNAADGSFGDASGVVWIPLIDDQATLAVGSIAVSPDPASHIVLVGTGETDSSLDSYYGLGILRSADEGSTWTLVSTDLAGTHPFAGMGFSKIAFSTLVPSLVVAGTGSATQGDIEGLENPLDGANRGIYYSTNAGITWSYAVIKDGSATVAPGSVTSVAYSAVEGKFFAALRSHGFYSSTDGINWTRLATQPGTGLTTGACPASPASNTCPIYRGEIAVVHDPANPARDEMYVWFVNSSSTNQHIWKTTNGGTSWIQLNDAGITSCGDTFGGCGTSQGIYNLELAAVPNGATSTDIYAGAINIFKCAITGSSPTCGGTAPNAFVNLTHVYGCSPLSAPAHVHPDQHALDFMIANGKSLLYFANDGGIYRSLDGFTGLTTGSCSGTNQFDSLNQTLGSMTQFVSFSQHPTDDNIILGGTQDNGSPATAMSQSSIIWQNVNGGDGGFNQINPDNPIEWFTANTDVSIQRCGLGIQCRAQDFSNDLVVSNASVGGDSGPFYTPYVLDPQNSSQMIVGTCRVWRGSSDGTGSGWATGGGSALSPNFETGAGGCTGSEINLVRSLVAGGTFDSGGSHVIYAGTDGYGPLASNGGHIWISTNANGGTNTWQDRTSSINPGHFPISGIALDPLDPLGLTAYVAIMGFHVSHVFQTTNGGASWTDFSGSGPGALPDAPANAILVDPDPNPSVGTLYVATDVGVYSTSIASANWTEVGPAPTSGQAGYLPNVAVTALRMFKTSGEKKLRASTYGRGVWEFDLLVTPDFQISFASSVLNVFSLQNATFDGILKSSNGFNSPVTLSCTTSAPPLPVPCTPSPTPLTPTPSGASFTVTAGGIIGDYAFDLHGIASDANTTTHDAGLVLHVVDFGLTAPSPNSVTVNVPNTSPAVAFQATASGSFQAAVVLSCAGLPAGAACSFLPSNTVHPTSISPVDVTLNISTAPTTPGGTYPVTISADTAGAPTPKTQPLVLIVTALPDYVLTVSNSPLTAPATGLATFNGTLTAFNGYNSAVGFTCGGGSPQSCAGSPVTPTSGGVPFTVTVSSDIVQAYNFNIVGTGTDPTTITHTAAVTFTTTFDFSVTDTSDPQAISAGGAGVYRLDVMPLGSNFANDVNFSVSGCPPRSACSFNPFSVSSGSGDTTVVLTATTSFPIGARSVESRTSALPGDWVWFSPALLVMLAGLTRKSDKKRHQRRLCLMSALVLLALLPACGGGQPQGAGGQPGTPRGNYDILVTATSGGLTHTSHAFLTVQ